MARPVPRSRRRLHHVEIDNELPGNIPKIIVIRT